MRHLYHFAKSFLGLACLVLCLSTGAAFAQTTTFTFKGQLTDVVGLPASGSYEMQFKLFDALTDGNQIGTTLRFNEGGSPPSVKVVNGVYTVQLDYGAEAFPGADRYLQVEVRYAGEPLFTPLSPRRQFTSTPYAIRTLSATAADSLSPACNGCVLNSNIQSVAGDKVSGSVDNANNATSAVTAGNVTGVVQITNGGTGSSTQNFVDLFTNQTISGDKHFTGAVNVDGILTGSGAGLLNLNGGNLVNASVTRSKLADGVNARYDLPLLGMLRWDLLPTPKTINAGVNPSALAFDGTFIYVTNRSGNTVTRIRASTGIVEGFSIHAGGEPCALAFDGTFIYVANRTGNSVMRIRASTGVAEGSPIIVGANPSALAFDGTFIYVANAGINNVIRIRASNAQIEGHSITVGTNPSALTFDGTFIYVANAGSNSVTRIRASNALVEGNSIHVGTNPSALAFDGTYVYVANAGSNNVNRIRASDGSIASAIGVGGRQSALAFDGTFMYVSKTTGGDSVARIRAFTGDVDGTAITIGGHLSGLAFDGTFVYVANGTSVIRF